MKSVFVLLVTLASVLAAVPALAGPILVTDITDATVSDYLSSEAFVAEARWGNSLRIRPASGVDSAAQPLTAGVDPQGSLPAMQLQAGDIVPEPGTLALVGLGLAGITFGTVRRRHRN